MTQISSSDEFNTGESRSGSDAAFHAAAEDLEKLRQLLVRAGQGIADPTEAKAAVEAYWRDHEDALRLCVSGLAEQVRAQMLEALAKWRDQVGQRSALT